VVRTGDSVTHTLELPNRPRPAAEIRRSDKASDSATGGDSETGTARSGDRYIGRRPVSCEPVR
jgi:hypothetical protein